MTLAQSRFWRASYGKGSVALVLQKTTLPEDLHELRELRIEVPLARWNRLVKNVNADRKLLGGLLLDFAKSKDKVSALVGSDRLLGELRRVVVDATASLIEDELLVLGTPEGREES